MPSMMRLKLLEPMPAAISTTMTAELSCNARTSGRRRCAIEIFPLISLDVNIVLLRIRPQHDLSEIVHCEPFRECRLHVGRCEFFVAIRSLDRFIESQILQRTIEQSTGNSMDARFRQRNGSHQEGLGLQ